MGGGGWEALRNDGALLKGSRLLLLFFYSYKSADVANFTTIGLRRARFGVVQLFHLCFAFTLLGIFPITDG